MDTNTALLILVIVGVLTYIYVDTMRYSTNNQNNQQSVQTTDNNSLSFGGNVITPNYYSVVDAENDYVLQPDIDYIYRGYDNSWDYPYFGYPWRWGGGYSGSYGGSSSSGHRSHRGHNNHTHNTGNQNIHVGDGVYTSGPGGAPPRSYGSSRSHGGSGRSSYSGSSGRSSYSGSSGRSSYSGSSGGGGHGGGHSGGGHGGGGHR